MGKGKVGMEGKGEKGKERRGCEVGRKEEGGAAIRDFAGSEF